MEKVMKFKKLNCQSLSKNDQCSFRNIIDAIKQNMRE